MTTKKSAHEWLSERPVRVRLVKRGVLDPSRPILDIENWPEDGHVTMQTRITFAKLVKQLKKSDVVYSH